MKILRQIWPNLVHIFLKVFSFCGTSIVPQTLWVPSTRMLLPPPLLIRDTWHMTLTLPRAVAEFSGWPTECLVVINQRLRGPLLTSVLYLDPTITFMKVIVTFYQLLWIRLLIVSLRYGPSDYKTASASPSIRRHDWIHVWLWCIHRVPLTTHCYMCIHRV